VAFLEEHFGEELDELDLGTLLTFLHIFLDYLSLIVFLIHGIW